MVLCHTLLYHSEQHGIWSYYVESYRAVWFHMHIHIILDYIVPYTVPNYMVSYRIVLYDLLSLLYHVVSYRTVWYRVFIPYRTKAWQHTYTELYDVISYHVLSSRTMWYRIKLCDKIYIQTQSNLSLVLYCLPNYMVSYHIILFCIIPYPILSYCMMLYIFILSYKLQHITHRTIIFCFAWTNSKQLV